MGPGDDPLSTEDVKHGGVENFSRGFNSHTPPVTSHPVMYSADMRGARQTKVQQINEKKTINRKQQRTNK